MSYNITQKQAENIAEEVGMQYTRSEEGIVRDGSPEKWTEFANAVLDKVLGEPVGIIEAHPKPNPRTSTSSTEYELVANVFTLPAGTKLYAPKELP